MNKNSQIQLIKSQEDIKTVFFETIIDTAEQQLLWEIYQRTFLKDVLCTQEQMCYNEVAFKNSLIDPEYQKFIVYSKHTPMGFSLSTNNLEKARVSYINPYFFKNKYPLFSKNNRIYYVTALSVSPKIQSLKYIKNLLRLMIHFIINNDAMVTFDFSENKNSLLPKIIKMVGETQNIPISGGKLDAQTYFELHGSLNSNPE